LLKRTIRLDKKADLECKFWLKKRLFFSKICQKMQLIAKILQKVNTSEMTQKSS